MALAVKQAAPQNPVVFLGHADPIEFGVVSNLAHPGGNVTGIAGNASEQIAAKRLEFLKEVLPSLARVAVLSSTERNRSSGEVNAFKAAAKAIRVQLDEIEVDVPEALEAAIRAAKDRGVQGVYVWAGGFSFAFGKQISDIANTHGLPSIHPFRQSALAGGLLAYASDLREMARRGAAYVDKILRGTQAGSLPVEQMSKYELLINVKTAKVLGLTIPPALLVRADEVID